MNTNKTVVDVLSSDTEATSSVVNETPPIEIIDLTDDIEDEIIACDDYNAMYQRSLAIRQIFPSLNDDSNWTGKWMLKPDVLPNLGESVAISKIELYTDEEIDYDNWNAAINLAIAKISKIQNFYTKTLAKFSENRVPKRRPLCVPEEKGSKYECTRCHSVIYRNMISGDPHPQLCFPKRSARFHPYVR